MRKRWSKVMPKFAYSLTWEKNYLFSRDRTLLEEIGLTEKKLSPYWIFFFILGSLSSGPMGSDGGWTTGVSTDAVSRRRNPRGTGRISRLPRTGTAGSLFGRRNFGTDRRFADRMSSVASVAGSVASYFTGAETLQTQPVPGPLWKMPRLLLLKGRPRAGDTSLIG